MSFASLLPRSAIPGIVWPPIPGVMAARVLALLQQLDRSQWWPAAELRRWQSKQLQALLDHAFGSVPYYREDLHDQVTAELRAESMLERLQAVPLLTRAAVQRAGERLNSIQVPLQHGALATLSTAGSTGRPVTINKTQLTSLIWHALILREHAWHGRDLAAKMAVIRFVEDPARARAPEGLHQSGWDTISHVLYETGPCALLAIDTPVREQVQWLQRENPDYLLTYPTNLAALLECLSADQAPLPRLRAVQTISEAFDPDLRARCREVLGIDVVDSYSSQEVGLIASQCPTCAAYHVHAEAALVEVLRPNGAACRPGEVGRVVVTDLHNFATPLIRYEIGDLAEVGEACRCGRGLPVLTRILGRVRNMLTLPDGQQLWPRLRNQFFAEVAQAPIEQIQIVQKSLQQIEIRLVCARLTPEQEQRVARLLCQALGHRFDVAFQYCETIPRSRGGKFEEFLSEL